MHEITREMGIPTSSIVRIIHRDLKQPELHQEETRSAADSGQPDESH